ncbi:hypothetical protein CDAR_164821 [Caerostris darwini]|uniref:Uncharacterized protein n=1 Tax=Caerostris darwini TaxID=1538125 RepID=A0AAV4RLY2_9ARAC|nr:hypothetical protein CDAR_164821 [Caerostris darwini]
MHREEKTQSDGRVTSAVCHGFDSSLGDAMQATSSDRNTLKQCRTLSTIFGTSTRSTPNLTGTSLFTRQRRTRTELAEKAYSSLYPQKLKSGIAFHFMEMHLPWCIDYNESEKRFSCAQSRCCCKKGHRQPGIKSRYESIGAGIFSDIKSGQVNDIVDLLIYMPTFTSSHTKLTRSPGESVSSSQNDARCLW